MSEMVERVARDIHNVAVENGKTGVPWNDTSRPDAPVRDMRIAQAQAAIEAMQEPTDEMIDFGHKIYTETSDVRDAYVAMVHTAYSRDIPY